MTGAPRPRLQIREAAAVLALLALLCFIAAGLALWVADAVPIRVG